MKKIFVIALAFFATTAAIAQQKDSTAAKKPLEKPAVPTTLPPAKKDWSKVKLTRRANDHFMFQLGYTNWAGATDSMAIQGFNRSANFYVMFDFPFKTDVRWSVAPGIGLGTDNVYFNKEFVGVGTWGNTSLSFTDQSQGDHYKKNKVTTVYLEAPIELRYAIDPENTNHSWKFALGVKVGLMLSAYYKGKTLQNIVDQTIASVTEKQYGKQFFNSPRLAATARVSKGVIGLFGQFQATSLLKAGTNPTVYPYTIGITLSGL